MILHQSVFLALISRVWWIIGRVVMPFLMEYLKALFYQETLNMKLQ